MEINMDVAYRNPKKYKTAKLPIRQPIYLTWLIEVLSRILLSNKQYKVEKIGMEGLKPPYMILSNHMSFIDFELVSRGTYPHRVNNVVNIDGYYRRPWLLEWIGAICTRKFTRDMHLIKSIREVLRRGDVLCMYPEARYSPAGVTSYLPDSLGSLVKLCRVPIVVAIHRGNYLHAPFWNFRRKRKVPLHTTMKLVFTPEMIEEMSVDEINTLLRSEFEYDEYKYQKENGILITEPYRAEGLDKILYKCPHCMAENMHSEGAEIYCDSCKKRWTLLENGDLSANEGDTEFAAVPDWFAWEREEVLREIKEGRYRFSSRVDVHSLPRCWRFEHLGEATLTHSREEGFVLKGNYNGSPYEIRRAPLETNSLHVEYDFPHIKPYDCVDISTENDSFYCFPEGRNVVTKLSLATEEIFKLALAEKRRS